jgi:N-acetylglucosamine-6-phosphate deacetylase
MKTDSEGARLIGVHLEGPFIAEKFAGAQPSEYILSPNVEDFDEFNAASGNNIKIVTIAPEKEGAENLISHLTKLNIVASIGHSNAGYDDVVKAMQYGASSVTHTFNAQSPLHHREIGVVGSALSLDELNTEIICDGIHISLPAINLLLKSKPLNKVTLITDSMRAKGLPDGESELGGQKVIVCNGSARLENGVLAGSILKMNDAIKLLVTKLNIPLTQAVDYATINPATLLNINTTHGSIKQNKLADFTVLNKDFEVLLTIVSGTIVYKKD